VVVCEAKDSDHRVEEDTPPEIDNTVNIRLLQGVCLLFLSMCYVCRMDRYEHDASIHDHVCSSIFGARQ
jgi:hypothetical protein